MGAKTKVGNIRKKVILLSMYIPCVLPAVATFIVFQLTVKLKPCPSDSSSMKLHLPGFNTVKTFQDSAE